ncbi:MAG: MBOAT family protein [Gemmatimonadetes bacterium]|nr:MBOAT family protein [Gemmatimonadota bacterium]
MLFNSLEFPIFLLMVFAGYWGIGPGRVRVQNSFLILASYFFYGWWDWRFLGLIILSSAVDFWVGLGFRANSGRRARKALLFTSLTVNLGVLGFFKYFDFFAGSFEAALASLGLHADLFTLNVVLPVGISFYTFQTLSYSIDIYRGKIRPIDDPVAFFAFVSFFPQLVAGPIERAQRLLPQFQRPRALDPAQASDGLKQILWGFVKKVVVADNLAPSVEAVFSGSGSAGGAVLLVGTFLFSIQIYCDFSGYSDIAIGTGRLFGFSLSRNFAFPYFARDIGEFWHRWHISLSTWFRDYVFIPLGGSRCSQPRRALNVMVTFVLSGLWHGANWTFVAWGFLHGLYYVVQMVYRRFTGWVREGPETERVPRLRDLPWMAVTFGATLLAWVFFRSESLSQAFGILATIFSDPLSKGAGVGCPDCRFGLVLSACVLAIEWLQRDKQHALDLRSFSTALRWACYAAAVLVFLTFGRFESSEFIYFQF